MGMYTDYGRFMKARQFKNWCNSGAGIWFGFGMGSPRWDYEVLVDSTRSKPNVPTSSPSAFTPLYKWFATYKNPEWESPSIGDLADQEYTLLDGSAIIETEEVPTPTPYIKTNDELREEALTFPDENLSPSMSVFYNRMGIPYIRKYLWDPSYKDEPTEVYPSPFIPPFPVSYYNDWISHLESMGTGYDPESVPTVPSDPSEYENYSYAKYFHDVYNRNVYLGFLSFIQGKAYFVEPIEDTEVQESIKTFKYGKHYWRIVPDADINYGKLPHHILLTATVFPNELINDTIAERYLLVRQVSVFKFPDYLASQWGLNDETVPRSRQVVRADTLKFVPEKSDIPVLGEKTVPFNCVNPLDPNDTDNPTAEMLINDFMTGRQRDIQQTDRYGYIIGF